MKKAIFLFFCFFVFNMSSLFTQDNIECRYYAAKKKIVFKITNNSQDTVRLSLKSIYHDFWNSPTLNEDYSISGDTLYLIFSHFPTQSIQSNGEPLRYRVEGLRSHNQILPSQSFEFYLKIKNAKEIAADVKHVQIISNWKVPPVKTIRLIKNNIKIRFKPIKVGRLAHSG